WRTTHNPLELPEMLNEKQYDPSAIFIWQAPKPPMPHNNKQFDDFYNGWQRDIYKRTWMDLLVVTGTKIRLCYRTYYWLDLLLVLPGFWFVLKRPRFRIAFAAGAASIGGFFLLSWSNPHYVAPATCVIFGATILAMRQVRQFRVRHYEI